MITANDIHHIVGAVYCALGDLPEEVVLGERLLDVKAKSRRDVDIAVIRTNRRGIVAAEVKAKSRRLDIEAVEGLCCKLGDMPAISAKVIVSLSGYTKPALRKAAAYGVRCFHLKRGCSMPAFASIDISRMETIAFSTPEWIDGPHVTLLLERELLASECAKLRKTSRVVYPFAGLPLITIEELQRRMITAAQQEIEITETPAPVAVHIQITDQPAIRVKTGTVRIDSAEVTGSIRRVTYSVKPSDMFYLVDEAGVSLGGAVVAELGDTLVSLAAGQGSSTLHVAHLPPRVRALKPFRRRIYPPPAT